jgi:hypothetical protein
MQEALGLNPTTGREEEGEEEGREKGKGREGEGKRGEGRKSLLAYQSKRIILNDNIIDMVCLNKEIS